MPIYEYRCTACDKAFERLVRGDTKVRCPACESAKVERLISAPARHGGSSLGSGGDYSALGPMGGGGGGGCGGGGCGCH